MAPARSSEKDLKLEQVGLEGTGFAITTLSASLISIFNLLINSQLNISRAMLRGTWSTDHINMHHCQNSHSSKTYFVRKGSLM